MQDMLLPEFIGQENWSFTQVALGQLLRD